MFARNRAPLTMAPAGYRLDIDRRPPESRGGCGRAIGWSMTGLILLFIVGMGIYLLTRPTEPPQIAQVIMMDASTPTPPPTATLAPTDEPELTDEPAPEVTDEATGTPTMIPFDPSADISFSLDATQVYQMIVDATATEYARWPVSPEPPSIVQTAIPIERVITSPPVIIVQTVQPPPVVIVQTSEPVIIVQTSAPVVITATPYPTNTLAPEVTDEPTARPTDIPTATHTATDIPTQTPLPTDTATATATATATPTLTPSMTWTAIPSSTMFPTLIPSLIPSATPTAIQEPTDAV
jgi:hypothetical protein